MLRLHEPLVRRGLKRLERRRREQRKAS
jgi:hypothetical protein